MRRVPVSRACSSYRCRRSRGYAVTVAMRLNRFLCVVVSVLAISCSGPSGKDSLSGSATSVAETGEPPAASLTTAPPSSLVPVSTAEPAPGPPIVPPFPEVSFTAEDVFVRDCGLQIVAADAIADVHPDDQIGPLRLFGLRDAVRIHADQLTPSSIGELGVQKYVTTLDGDETVWLAVARKDRPYVSLIYDPKRWLGNEVGLPLDAGDPVVRFDACGNSSGYTQYPGRASR